MGGWPWLAGFCVHGWSVVTVSFPRCGSLHSPFWSLFFHMCPVFRSVETACVQTDWAYWSTCCKQSPQDYYSGMWTVDWRRTVLFLTQVCVGIQCSSCITNVWLPWMVWYAVLNFCSISTSLLHCAYFFHEGLLFSIMEKIQIFCEKLKTYLSCYF